MNLPIIPSALTSSYNYSSSVCLFRSPPSPEDPGQSFSVLAHEIRNPLTNISLAIAVLKQTCKDEDQEVYLDIIMRNSVRINNMITDFLTSGNTNDTQQETHSVRAIIEEVLSMNKDRIVLKNIAVRKNFSVQDFKIKINYAKVKIALTNIIINAIEAMAARRGILEITTKLMHGICYIVIKDNGTGISKENLNSIFQPYFTNKPGGMGLGLSGALSLLSSNHIDIVVRSEVGVGTRFILSYKNELL